MSYDFDKLITSAKDPELKRMLCFLERQKLREDQRARDIELDKKLRKSRLFNEQKQM
jgi:tRNA A-37 threonylcarbamoyl transferase component Bud32